MALIPSTGLRDSQASALATTFDSAFLNLYTGSQPPSPDDAPTGTLLVTLTLNSPAFSGPVDGILSRGSTWEGSAVASGDIGWGRFVLSGDSGGDSNTDIRFDVDVGKLPGSLLRVPNLSIKSGQKVRINQVRLEFPIVESGIGGQSNLTFPQLLLLASGLVEVVGEANITLPSLELESDGSALIDSVANLVLPQFELVSAGNVDVQGESDLTLPQFELIASSETTFLGEAELELPQFSLAASGGVEVGGISNLSLPQLQLNATATSPRFGVANLSIPQLILVSSGNSGVIPPPVNWPNDPGGSGLLIDTDWVSDTFVSNRTAQGWRRNSSTDVIFENVPLTPFGTTRILSLIQRNGLEAGFGPQCRLQESDFSPFRWQRLYAGFWLRFSANFYGEPGSAVNKTAYVYGVEQGGFASFMWAEANGVEYNPMNVRFVPQGACGCGTYSAFGGDPGVVKRDVWQLWEVFYERTNDGPNGRFRIWIDNVKYIDRNDVCNCPVNSSHGIYGFTLSAIWGGRFTILTTGDQKQQYGSVRIRALGQL